MTSPHDPEPGRDSTSRNARDTSLTGDRARPHRMPVMGWIREISAVENWRTATIVRRHRDSAVTPTS